ncbi:unnamed protein product [Didymodactylos carnosus]|uniref:B box-type domain-containing protein n=1 Tax=Didymodactylos carnosus TaxID=1234261 RepID=A0A815LB11_9BILA|nr:unnamed protein product [Didymodactylos carnosus]CAF1405550.1 unnamed protein product [Didymodactylos carnosus]CAF4184414.1 unnamed protein product [Didymodactylos carnosus]CAF4297157.1 unnamed protein product [Didymodactylos carnosus]
MSHAPNRAALSKKCDVCQERAGTLSCTGCEQVFCKQDMTKHRQQLSRELDLVMREHNNLDKRIQHKMTGDQGGHRKLLDQINEWEKSVIDKIKDAAQQAREQVHLFLGAQPAHRLRQITDDIESRMKEEDYVETDIEYWSNQVKKLSKEIEMGDSTSIVIKTAQVEWTSLIKVQEILPGKTRRTLDYGRLKSEASKVIKDERYIYGSSPDFLLLHADGQSLCLSDRTGKNKIEINFKSDCWINDACWSTFLNGFIILTGVGDSYTLDVAKRQMNVIGKLRSHDKKIFRSCTCSGETLLISTYEKGSSIESGIQL